MSSITSKQQSVQQEERSDMTVLVQRQEGHPACKTFGVGSLVVTI